MSREQAVINGSKQVKSKNISLHFSRSLCSLPTKVKTGSENLTHGRIRFPFIAQYVYWLFPLSVVSNYVQSVCFFHIHSFTDTGRRRRALRTMIISSSLLDTPESRREFFWQLVFLSKSQFSALPWLVVVLIVFCLCYCCFRSHWAAQPEVLRLAFQVRPHYIAWLKKQPISNEPLFCLYACNICPEAWVSRRQTESCDCFDGVTSYSLEIVSLKISVYCLPLFQRLRAISAFKFSTKFCESRRHIRAFGLSHTSSETVGICVTGSFLFG